MSKLSKFIEGLEGQPIAVMGLGLSGMSVVKAFCQGGANVYAWDDAEQAKLLATQHGAIVQKLDKKTLKECLFLVLAPGIPSEHEVARTARDLGMQIICDIELFHRLKHGHKTIGITGTNGKSTTTALLYHVLQEAGRKSIVGGNIGKPVFDIEIPDEETVFVFEISSYQLDLCSSYAPDISLLLNITPDHLDRHGNMLAYMKAKQRIFRGRGLAVIGQDDEFCVKTAQDQGLLKGRDTILISAKNKLDNGVYVEDGFLYEAVKGKSKKLFSLQGLPSLKGVHNYQNIAAVYAVAKQFDIPAATFEKALKNFEGLPHRQYPITKIGRVTYINDSKATNAEATSKALSSYEDIFWIVGGRAKAGGLDGLEEFKDKIKHAYIIGEALPAFRRWMGRNGVPYKESRVLDIALQQAHEGAQKFSKDNDRDCVVLLSPACASFDQFKSYEKRGERFTTLVQQTKERLER